MLQTYMCVGRLTRDPEVRYVGTNNMAVCDLGVAVNERRKVGDEWKEEPVYLDVTCWGKTAEVAGEYLSKGRLVGITGKLRLDKWQDKDGNNRSKLVVVCNELKLLDSAKKNGDVAPKNEYSGSIEDAPVNESGDNDIPF